MKSLLAGVFSDGFLNRRQCRIHRIHCLRRENIALVVEELLDVFTHRGRLPNRLGNKPLERMRTWGRSPFSLDARRWTLDALGLHAFSTSMKASCGMFTEPNDFIRFLPSFCFSSNFRLRVISPP